jgi:hypothetical protein
MICANRVVCAFPHSWLVDGTRPTRRRRSSPRIRCCFISSGSTPDSATADATSSRLQVGEGEALV